MSRRPIFRISALAAAVLFGIGAASRAQQESADAKKPPASPSPRVAELSWFKGDWSCTLGRTPVQEHWFAASGSALMGACSMGNDPKHNVFEILLIEESPNGLTLSLRHFKSGLTPHFGEDPLQYTLAGHSDQSLVFENPQSKRHKRIAYRRDGAQLVCRLEGGGPDGKHEIEFRMDPAH